MLDKITLPDTLVRAMMRFLDHGFEVYNIGGGVRDAILGLTPKDYDLTTNATPDQIQSLFPDSFYTNDFGTVTIRIPKNDTELDTFEVTPYRTEGIYHDFRRPESVTWGQTLSEDVHRRDFTVNALACDVKGQVVDLVGGLQDLEKGLIKAVGNPSDRFNEDALRILRAVRFCAQLGFTLENSTLEAVIACNENLQHISGERIRDELMKIVVSKYAADAILLLHSTGILKLILPELHDCFGVSQVSPNRHHKFDVGTHQVESLRNCPSNDPITRFATLLHDIGKVSTYQKDESTGQITFYNHEVVGAHMTKAIASRLKMSKEDQKKLFLLVRFHMFTVNEYQSDTALRRFIRSVGVENLTAIIDLRVSDRLGSGAKLTSWRTELFKKRLEEVQVIPFLVKDMLIKGEDVMKTLEMAPGPRVGQILSAIFAKVDSGEIPNDREVLLEELKNYKNFPT